MIVAIVALVAAAASYQHQRTLAALAGEGWLAWALPISVDGMMLATGSSILRRRRAGIPVPFLSWFGFALGLDRVRRRQRRRRPPHPHRPGSSPPGHPSPCSSPTRPSPPTIAISPTPDVASPWAIEVAARRRAGCPSLGQSRPLVAGAGRGY